MLPRAAETSQCRTVKKRSMGVAGFRLRTQCHKLVYLHCEHKMSHCIQDRSGRKLRHGSHETAIAMIILPVGWPESICLGTPEGWRTSKAVYKQTWNGGARLAKTEEKASQAHKDSRQDGESHWQRRCQSACTLRSASRWQQFWYAGDAFSWLQLDGHRCFQAAFTQPRWISMSLSQPDRWICECYA